MGAREDGDGRPASAGSGELARMIEDGVRAVLDGPRWRDYMRTMARFHHYSYRNSLLIMMQRPDAELVAGYQAWRKVGRQVGRGERGIRILCPCVRRRGAGDGEEGADDDEYVSGFTVGHVFDVKQTSGRELPSPCAVLDFPVERFEAVRDALAAASPVPVEFGPVPGGVNGFFTREGGGRVVVRDDMPQAQTLKTLAHEVAHALLHGDGGEQEGAGREAKEVQAESVAFAVCDRLGLDTSEYSFGYIASWSAGRGLDELRGSIESIQRAADAILSRADPALGVDSRGPRADPPERRRDRGRGEARDGAPRAARGPARGAGRGEEKGRSR